MNPIETFILAHPQAHVMDRLQAEGVISDLCVEAGDIAQADWAKAMAFLEGAEFP